MPFSEFLRLTQVIRNLYGRDCASKFFESNVSQFYNLGDFDPRNHLSIH